MKTCCCVEERKLREEDDDEIEMAVIGEGCYKGEYQLCTHFLEDELSSFP